MLSLLPCPASACLRRSNLDNHPGKISEPSLGRRRNQASSAGSDAAASSVQAGLLAAGLITLSSKTGMPKGYVGKRAGSDSESASDSESDSGDKGAANQRRKDESKEEKKARYATGATMPAGGFPTGSCILPRCCTTGRPRLRMPSARPGSRSGRSSPCSSRRRSRSRPSPPRHPPSALTRPPLLEGACKEAFACAGF